MFSADQLARWVAPQAFRRSPSLTTIAGVSIDSRRVRPGDLYVAIRGERFDGHDFIDQALANGAVAVLVDRDGTWPAGVVLVDDTRAALGRLAHGWRTQFDMPLIAVTGSNGKTTVKEMIAAIGRAAYGPAAVHATAGNLNNDIGVPLTLLAMRASHKLSVVELGTNHPGEIAALAALACPRVALVTNAQREHQEFLSGTEGSARENGSVFRALSPGGTAVFPLDDACAPIWRALCSERAVHGFALGGEPAMAAAVASPNWPDGAPSVHGAPAPGGLNLTIAGRSAFVELAIEGRHNVRNALAAAACASAAGLPFEAIVQGLTAFRPVAGRMVPGRASAGAELIDDTYNANPDSVLAAIDVLAARAGTRILVLGDMGEVGSQGPAFHREVGAHALASGVDRLHALGDLSREAVAVFGRGASHHDTLEALLGALRQEAVAGAVVLVKGSRFMRMERVVAALKGEPISEGAH